MNKGNSYFQKIFLFVTLFYQNFLFGQDNNFIVTKLTIKDGLPSNIIWNIEWSKNDNLWLSTQVGLIEYNGNKIIKSNLTHQFVDIQLDKNKNLIALDKFGDLYAINDDHNPIIKKHYSNNNNPRNYFQNYSGFFLQNTIFNTVKNSKAFDFGWFNNKIYQKDENSFVKETQIDKKFKKYELFTYSKQKLTIKSSLICSNNECLFILNNKFYFIDKKNVIQEINSNFQATKFIGILNISSSPDKHWIQRNKQERLCLIADKKVFSIQITNNTLNAKIIAEVKTDEIIKNIAYNYKLNTCILATEANGIYIFKEPKVEIIKPVNKTKTKSLYIQIPISNSQILTTGLGIIGSGKYTNANGLKTTIDKSWCIDWNQRIWYSGEDKISYFKKGGLKSIEFHELKNQGAWSFISDNFHKIIYLHNSTGFYQIDSNDKLSCILQLNQKFDPNNQANEFKLFGNYLFLGTNNGLSIFNTLNRKIEKNLFKGDLIRGISKFGNSYLVCNYGKSLYCLNADWKATPIELDQLTYLKYAHALYLDNKKNLWISTNNGIIYGSNELLKSILHKKNFRKNLHYINYVNGLDELELNGGGNSSIIEFNKKLCFLSTNGIVEIDPENWNNYTENYNFYIEVFGDDNKKVDIKNDEVYLDYNNEYCNIDIISTNWNNIADNRYQYFWQNQWHWINGNESPLITLKTKEHGDFNFEIIKYNKDGSASIVKKLTIHISLKWSETWWGISIILLFSGILIYVILKIRLKRINKINSDLNETISKQTQELVNINRELEESNEKKSQIIAILGHDLFVPLKFLSQVGNAMIKNYKSMSHEEIIDALTSISNTSNRLSMLCKNILNWIQYEKNEIDLTNQEFEVNEVIDQMIQIISMAAKQKGNKIIKTLPTNKIINTNLDALGIVILNLLNNANRFSENSTIYIECFKDNNNQLIIKVKDEGIGIREEIRQILLKTGSYQAEPDTDFQKSSGIGYYIIHEILKSVNGKINIEPNENNIGTTVEIHWPLLAK
jgi:signal transduction histidine kinase